MEKIGLGPNTLMTQNPGLIYARLTGYGQDGPLSDRAGHDINFLSISGVLSTLGRSMAKPQAPVNLLADFAGGSFVCALGIMMALNERHSSGLGQVIDSSMVEGAAYLSSFLWTSRGFPFLWPEGAGRGEGLLDGGAASYDTYETKDGKFVAVGALEPQFYETFIARLGIEDPDSLPDDLYGKDLKRIIADKFRDKTRDEWRDIFENSDACVTPVLEWNEVGSFHHNRHRKSFDERLGFPLPAPILGRTPAAPVDLRPVVAGQHSMEILAQLGYRETEMEELLKNGVVRQKKTKL